MAKLKKEIKSDFTVIHNGFTRDQSLGINARGILITMLSLPEYNSDGEPWNFSIKGLASILPDGKLKVQTALNELEKHGYLLRKKILENGKFVDMEYIFSDQIMPEALEVYQKKQAKKAKTSSEESVLEDHSPYPENQDAVKPHPEKPYPGFRDTEKPDTEKPDTENRDDNIIYSDKINKDKYNYDNLSYLSKENIDSKLQLNESDRIDKIDFSTTLSKVKDQIEYDCLLYSYDKSQIDEIAELITWCMCTPEQTVKINGTNIDIALVRSKCEELNSEHIGYILDCLQSNTTEIKNRRNYLLTCIYNAPTTMEGYYASKVQHDLYGN